MPETVMLNCQLLAPGGKPVESPIAHPFTVSRSLSGKIELKPASEIVFPPAIGQLDVRWLQITGEVDGEKVERLIELNYPAVINPEFFK